MISLQEVTVKLILDLVDPIHAPSSRKFSNSRALFKNVIAYAWDRKEDIYLICRPREHPKQNIVFTHKGTNPEQDQAMLPLFTT